MRGCYHKPESNHQPERKYGINILIWSFRKCHFAAFWSRIYLFSCKPSSVRDGCIESQLFCQSMDKGAASGQRNHRILISTVRAIYLLQPWTFTNLIRELFWCPFTCKSTLEFQPWWVIQQYWLLVSLC
jgi:hypothetical protein